MENTQQTLENKASHKPETLKINSKKEIQKHERSTLNRRNTTQPKDKKGTDTTEKTQTQSIQPVITTPNQFIYIITT